MLCSKNPMKTTWQLLHIFFQRKLLIKMLLRNNTKNNYNFMVSWSPSCFFNRIRNVVHFVQIVVLDIISESVLKSNNFDIKVCFHLCINYQKSGYCRTVSRDAMQLLLYLSLFNNMPAVKFHRIKCFPILNS
jgi:hypothetical protein